MPSQRLLEPRYSGTSRLDLFYNFIHPSLFLINTQSSSAAILVAWSDKFIQSLIQHTDRQLPLHMVCLEEQQDRHSCVSHLPFGHESLIPDLPGTYPYTLALASLLCFETLVNDGPRVQDGQMTDDCLCAEDRKNQAFLPVALFLRGELSSWEKWDQEVKA